MGRSGSDRSPLLRLLLLTAPIVLLCGSGWAAAKLTAAALLPLIALFVGCAIAGVACYRQHKMLRQRTAELREENLRLHGAVNNITQALLMFDADGRLALCNDRYREMYALSPEMVLPG